MLGIVSYGFYLPKYRIKVEEIAKVWGKNPLDIKKTLRIFEKTVASIDEDSLTMGFESASMALRDMKIDKKTIKSVLFGSETHPYAVNPASTILAEFLGIEKNYLAFDTEFACKAATGAMIASMGLINSGYTEFALVTASDKSTGKPHDSLEYTAASGSVSFILGKKDLVLEILDFSTFSSDTPDFWRREGILYPSHGGRFTGKPSYFYHIKEASALIFTKTGYKPKDFAYAVFHMPNGKFPIQLGRELGFEENQIKPSLIVPYLGNSYSASALMGLVSILDQVKEGDLIYLASYGSGAGSDTFILRATKNLAKRKRDFLNMFENKKYIDYSTYLKFMNII
ncbi:MAG: hydroxymethylglutaryl-CoA synthase [Actinobacteria bacterium]|nr:hydroxymethylglutaryl-CoA synthase [Actinomycetota bacterium]